MVGKTDGRSLGGPRNRWWNTMKTDTQETEGEGVEWIRLPQNTTKWRAVVNTVMDLRVS